MTDLLELADRVEAASGPDRELDELIARALDWCPAGLSPEALATWATHPKAKPAYWFSAAFGMPAYTSSLDAAMTLVPDDYRLTGLAETVVDCPDPWRAILWERKRNTRQRPFGDGATPALALTAASLRARAVSPSLLLGGRG